jgi:hypothetical protein
VTMLELGDILAPLIAATGGKPLDSEAAGAYYDGLSDVPAPTLQAAVGRLMRSCKWFPSVGEIRATCDLVKGRTFTTFTPPPVTPLKDEDPRLWYACVVCQDSGWASHWCEGSVQKAAPAHHTFQSHERCGSNTCARFGRRGYGHEYMRRCVCYSTNPKIHERLEGRKQYARPA